MGSGSHLRLDLAEVTAVEDTGRLHPNSHRWKLSVIVDDGDEGRLTTITNTKNLVVVEALEDVIDTPDGQQQEDR